MIHKKSSMSWEIAIRLLLFSMSSRAVVVAAKVMYMFPKQIYSEYSSILW